MEHGHTEKSKKEAGTMVPASFQFMGGARLRFHARGGISLVIST